MMSAKANTFVSILIPAHRAADYLARTLESVAAQTWTHWEVLVLEDGRLDGAGEVVKEFAGRVSQSVTHFVQDPAGGVSRARNRLLREATGTHVAFLDADDLWHPEHLAHALGLMEGGDADWFVGGYDLIDREDITIRAGHIPPKLEIGRMPTELLRHNFIITSSVVARRKIFAEVGLFDEELIVGEDLDLCLRILKAGFRPVPSPRATLRYRKHPASTTADPVRFSEEFSKVFEKYLDDPLVDPRVCREGFRDLLMNTIRLTWRRQPGRARAALWRLLRRQPFAWRAWIYLPLVAWRQG